ncbi:DUF6301 family protein [Nocardia sp. R6R-6]|uniref:DUF6301 family protein n=1 Tax=Nocardia sp. R6R-6 TaxID=3459303 RepID=UPI00403E31CA
MSSYKPTPTPTALPTEKERSTPMRVDSDRAIQVIQTAREFDWTWTVADLPGFAERVGWQLENLDQESPLLTTNLDVNRTKATVYLDNTVRPGTSRSLEGIWFFGSDVVLDDPSVTPVFNNAFDELAQRVFELVGQRPTRWSLHESNRSLGWDLDKVVLELATSGTFVRVRLISPAYQAWQDEIDRRIDPELTPDLDPVWRPH